MKTTIQQIDEDAMLGKINLDLVSAYEKSQSAHLATLKPGKQPFKTTNRCLTRARHLLNEVDDLARATVEDEVLHRRLP